MESRTGDEPADQVDFEHLVSDRRREMWLAAAEAEGVEIREWLTSCLDEAAESVLRRSGSSGASGGTTLYPSQPT